MAGEGEYPKADEVDTLYASEVNDFNAHGTGNGADHADVATNNSKVTNATHTSEVTGDGALTIASNIVDEDNLKLDEAPTNDNVLTADSAKSGGMKWAAPTGGNGGISIPIGGITAWLKTFTNTPVLPSEFVECNGQVLNDGASVYDTQTIPNLNGGSRFLRGAASSGGTGGADTVTLITSQMPSHNHGIDVNNASTTGTSGIQGSSYDNDGNPNSDNAGGGGAHENKPPYYNVVWVIRIK